MTNSTRKPASWIISTSAALLVLLLAAASPALAHGGGPSLELEKETVQAGSELGVRGTGYKGAKEITFHLRGTAGTEQLTTETVPGEDWNLTVSIPADTQSGTYQMIALGGGNQAEQRFEITPAPNGPEPDEQGPEGSESQNSGATDQQSDDRSTQESGVGHNGETETGGHTSSESTGEEASQDGSLPPGGVEVVDSPSRPGWLTGMLWAVALFAVGFGGFLLGSTGGSE